mmetsp:Transcript_12157/g.17466  ORF Transcript_12157/g.17466 Transcript_12157/m.17466 type:complete len:106 (-) Transcript_12157:489-806(-)
MKRKVLNKPKPKSCRYQQRRKKRLIQQLQKTTEKQHPTEKTTPNESIKNLIQLIQAYDRKITQSNQDSPKNMTEDQQRWHSMTLPNTKPYRKRQKTSWDLAQSSA